MGTKPIQPGQLVRAKYVEVAEEVYCYQHGCVHRNATDPYDEGQASCSRDEHRRVYYRAVRGDWP